MKRSMPWSDNEEDSASSDESSSSHSDSDVDETKGRDAAKHVEGQQSLEKKSQGKLGKRKGGAVDFEALKQHGYKGGRSVLSMRPREPDTQPAWSWSSGKERPRQPEEVEESYEQRQKTRAAILVGEQLTNVVTSKEREREKEKKNLSFSQKEKRKRDLGQASRGKNFVEEEKRLSRENGIYSGFDT